MSKQQPNFSSRPDQVETLSDQDESLFYGVLLFRQFARMIGSLGVFVILCAACYAEVDQLAQRWLGGQGEWLTVAFVTLLAISVRFVYTLLQDFIDDVRAGKRLQNGYTLIKSVGMLMGTASLLQFQLRLLNEEGSHSLFKVLWQLVF
ncbi:MAG: hypothetical protein V7739_12730 [Motiliproteus sp.]